MKFTKIEKTYDHGRGEFTFKGLACGALAYGKTTNGGRLAFQVMHVPTGKHVRTFKTATEARKAIAILLPLLDWTMPESELAEHAKTVRDALAA